MEWIILFVVSWILFVFLVDWKEIKLNIWCGVLAVGLQLSIDTSAMTHKFYKVNNGILNVWGSSLFFILGPVLVIGILLAQFHPEKRWMRTINVFIIAALYSLQELLLFYTEVLAYINWNFTDSVVVNIAAMVILSWFSIVVLKKGAGER